jgi:hypothetical protein
MALYALIPNNLFSRVVPPCGQELKEKHEVGRPKGEGDPFALASKKHKTGTRLSFGTRENG